VNINEHFTNTNIGEFCAYDPAGSWTVAKQT
jgi:hypothetical protein